ncbi:hypothetical protein WKH79_05545 [Qipengyuania sp. GPGPB31]|uniref:hypothetical protein n=1 Tax=Qipengyuania sp. GPGPB31 TaxID=3023518 RepID=UPI003134482F
MAGRAAIMLALGIPVAAGLLYLVLGSAPLAYPLANALALLIAVPIAAFAPLRLAERERRVLTLVLLALLFVPLVSGPHLGAVARWLPLGPVNLHAGALALPALVVLAARDEDYAPPILLAALLAASLQPDAATALAVMMAAVGLYNAGQDWRMVPVAGIAFLASIGAVLRGELPAQPFVERVLVDLALREPLAALGLGMALLAGFLMFAHALPAAKSTRHALAGSLFGFSLAAFVSNYPSVLIGYGAAPILGYGLALALARHTRQD